MMSIYSGDSSQRSIITVFAVGYAVVGTGEGFGPNGKIVLHILFGFTAAKVPAHRQQVNLNRPDVPMTDMEAAQRSAHIKALDAAFARVKALAD